MNVKQILVILAALLYKEPEQREHLLEAFLQYRREVKLRRMTRLLMELSHLDYNIALVDNYAKDMKKAALKDYYDSIPEVLQAEQPVDCAAIADRPIEVIKSLNESAAEILNETRSIAHLAEVRGILKTNLRSLTAAVDGSKISVTVEEFCQQAQIARAGIYILQDFYELALAEEATAD